MRYIFPDRFASHWRMLSLMVEERYRDPDPSAVMIMGLYINQDLEYYRKLHVQDKLIIYQLEPLCGQGHWWNADFIINQLRYADEVWDYDYQNCVFLQKHGINAHFKPIIHAENISIKEKNEKDIDVLFYGSFTEYRMKIMSRLFFDVNPNTVVHCLANVMHPMLDHYVSRSKIILNLHHAETQQQQEQTRLGYLLASGKTIISEKSTVNYYGDLIVETRSYDDLIRSIYSILGDYKEYDEVFRKRAFNALFPETMWERGHAWYLNYLTSTNT